MAMTSCVCLCDGIIVTSVIVVLCIDIHVYRGVLFLVSCV